MALPRTKPTNCTEHTIEINNLKKDMETVQRHEIKFNQTVERVEASVESLNAAVLKINIALEHFKDIPEKIRKLEDKSIVYDLIKVGLAVLFTIIVKDYYDSTVAIKEEKEYKVESTR
jgi:hypothetical protein